MQLTVENLNISLNKLELPKRLPRMYSGLSGVGAMCYRKLQYDHHLAYRTSHNVRIQRLFNVGHSFEDVLVKDLCSIGYSVVDQQRAVTGENGHWIGHIDGILVANKQRLLLECKTHNEKSFSDVSKKGVKYSKPIHYDQMQGYMGYLREENEPIESSLYCAYNKNNSEYYFEIVMFDESHFKDIKDKQFDIISSTMLYKRIGSNSRTWFECKLCDASDVCFGDAKVEKNCRTCAYVDTAESGKWECGLNGENLTEFKQLHGCDKYELNESLFGEG
jgi:ribosomal protein S27E